MKQNSMSLKEFKEAYEGAALDDSDLAKRAASELKPCNLQMAAWAFLEAQTAFYQALDEADFEQG